jgi:hypothetical protein
MARDIRPTGDVAPDEYVQRLSKLMPAEITGAYLAIASLLVPLHGGGDVYLLGSFCVLLVLLPLYLKFVLNMKNNLQIIVSTLSFPVWAANISNIPLSEDLHKYGHDVSPVIFGVVLILWTVATPLFVR